MTRKSTGKSKYKLLEAFEEAVTKKALAKAHNLQPEAIEIASILYEEAKAKLIMSIKKDRAKILQMKRDLEYEYRNSAFIIQH